MKHRKPYELARSFRTDVGELFVPQDSKLARRIRHRGTLTSVANAGIFQEATGECGCSYRVDHRYEAVPVASAAFGGVFAQSNDGGTERNMAVVVQLTDHDDVPPGSCGRTDDRGLTSEGQNMFSCEVMW